MLNSQKLVLCGSLLVLVLTGCKSEKGQNSVEAEEKAAKATVTTPEVSAPGLLSTLSVATEPGKSVVLAYRMNDQLSHRFHTEQTSARTGPSTMKNGIEQNFTLTRSMKAGEEEGTWLVEAAVKDVEVKPAQETKDKAAQDAVLRIKDALGASRFSYKMNQLGEVTEFSFSKGNQGFAGIGQVLEQIVKDAAITFPKDPVKPGDSWDASRSETLDHGRISNVMTFDMKTTFLGFASLEGRCRDCAVLRTSGTVKISGEVKSDSTQGSTSGVGSTDSVVVFDPARGFVVEAEVVSSMAQQFVMKRGAGEITLEETNELKMTQKWTGEIASESREKTQ